MSDRRSIRTARLVACALTVAAVAAPAAGARPAQEPPWSGAASAPEPAAPARVASAADDRSEWDSVAIGAGGATLVLALAGTGIVALSRRHQHVGAAR